MTQSCYVQYFLAFLTWCGMVLAGDSVVLQRMVLAGDSVVLQRILDMVLAGDSVRGPTMYF